MRGLPGGGLAALPTWGDGYEMGDLVYPVSPDEELLLPFRGVRWSDSFMTGDPGTSIEGRTTDSFAGGQAQFMWQLAKGAGPDGRSALAWESGMIVYDAPTVWLRGFPVVGSWRAVFEFRNESASHNGGVIIAGDPTDPAARRVVVNANGDGGDHWSIQHQPGDWAPTVALGSTAQPIWSTVAITVDGPSVTVDHGTARFAHTLTGAAADLPPAFGFTSGRWGTFAVRNVLFEVL